MTTQLYAKIKRSSEYYSQNESAKESGEFPFPVRIGFDGPDGKGYVIKGGPGGQYHVSDVHLFAYVEDGNGTRIEVKLS